MHAVRKHANSMERNSAWDPRLGFKSKLKANFSNTIYHLAMLHWNHTDLNHQHISGIGLAGYLLSSFIRICSFRFKLLKSFLAYAQLFSTFYTVESGAIAESWFIYSKSSFHMSLGSLFCWKTPLCSSLNHWFELRLNKLEVILLFHHPLQFCIAPYICEWFSSTVWCYHNSSFNGLRFERAILTPNQKPFHQMSFHRLCGHYDLKQKLHS